MSEKIALIGSTKSKIQVSHSKYSSIETTDPSFDTSSVNKLRGLISRSGSSDPDHDASYASVLSGMYMISHSK